MRNSFCEHLFCWWANESKNYVNHSKLALFEGNMDLDISSNKTKLTTIHVLRFLNAKETKDLVNNCRPHIHCSIVRVFFFSTLSLHLRIHLMFKFLNSSYESIHHQHNSLSIKTVATIEYFILCALFIIEFCCVFNF